MANFFTSIKDYFSESFGFSAPISRDAVTSQPLTTKSWSEGWGNSYGGAASYVAATNNSGMTVTEYTALNSSAVYACVARISEAIASFPLEITGPNFTKVPKHPILKLLRKPNEIMNRIEFMQTIVTALMLNGNSITYIKRNKAGEPIGLYPIHPNSVTWNWTVKDQGGTGLPYYTFFHPLTGQHSLVPLRDIIHLKNFGTGWGYDGVSPIAASQNTIGIALAQNKTVANYYSQSTISTGIISTDEDMAPEDWEAMKAGYKKSNTGTEASNGVLFLQKGIKFDPITLNSKDAQLLESRQFSIAEIARIYGVPLSILAYGDSKEVSNFEEDDLSFRNNTLFPICSKIEEAFEDKLLFEDERDEFKIEFNFDETQRTNALTRAQVQQLYLLNGVLNRNEVRAQEGLGQVPDGDIYRVPANTVDTSNIDKNQPAAHVDPKGGASEENQPV